jgi:multimeric flavodoxin WrbA
MQYVHYIQKKFPEHEIKIHNISERIRKIEKNSQIFQGILEEINQSDGILWASPVYYLLIPANYKRFIELISEKGVEDVFHAKYAAFLTTSIHFFDHTAHNYMNAICDDLNMRYIGSFSADMYDLKIPEEKKRLCLFAETFFSSIQSNTNTLTNYTPLIWQDFDYSPNDVTTSKLDPGRKNVLIVTDAENQQENLIRMIDRFKESFATVIETINLNDLDIKGSCQGCINCGYDNTCIYEGKDDYVDFYNKKIKTADILVFAGAIKDRYLSSKWKTFFDRSFFYNHTPSLTGKQIGFIISGPLRQISNLRQILEAYVEFQQANPVGFVTDEDRDSAVISSLLHDFGKRLIDFAEKGYIRPHTFFSVGGMKIFRDEIWGRFRFPFRADYLAYKKRGLFNFPQKNYKMRIQNAAMFLLLKISAFRKEANRRMKKEMIKPLEKFLEV